ncbi:GNAT family N-acetyltransferase [Aquimarina algiphila]|uniref:GNAT family N-acetyltransferase n=1 Tax=Aquimarina algiphila TaxID=2047982 RepID=UPI0024901855|nr:GNAT family N-acetyltransferase [Aquimarina algiphila]
MKELKLVKAKEKDKNFLLHLRKLTMVEHLEKAGIYLSDEEHLSRINFHYDSAYLILKSTEMAGLLKCIETEKTIEILQIQVLPKYQGQGIAKRLIKDLAIKAETSHKNLTLKVLKQNPAKYLYERIGFNITGEDEQEFHMKMISSSEIDKQ